MIDITNDNYYMPIKKCASKERKKIHFSFKSEKLEQTESGFVGISFIALAFLHRVPMEMPLDGLKILNNLIKEIFFSPAREHSHFFLYRYIVNLFRMAAYQLM